MQMRTKQGLQTMRKAHAFLASRTFTAAMGELKPQVEALAAIVQRLGDRATEQETSVSAARAATDAKRALAHALRMEYLRPIAQIARKLFQDDSELRKSFLVKPPRDDEGLIQLASAFAERAAQYKERFVEKGLAPDFVERLKKTIDDMRAVLVNRGLEQARRTSASVGLLQELARGRDQIRLVDAMLAPRLASRPEQLAEWRSIARFARSAQAEEAGTGTGTPTVPTTPPVAASLSTQPAPSTAETSTPVPEAKAA